MTAAQGCRRAGAGGGGVKREPPLWLAYCSFAGFLVFVMASLVMLFVSSWAAFWAAMIGCAVWGGFGFFFRRRLP